ncbi:MAG: class I SAM-dependent methyltransferase [Chloroflexi bacterium]|nr:MAG: class I SAM-dependent methyltransferase [Chloroflexota bacterium]
MTSKNDYQDQTYLQNEQYKDSANLDARASLHRRFSTAKVEWQSWVFDHMKLVTGNRVLECGCGPGWLWRNNLERIPAGCHITLTDLSPGMVAEAEAALANSGHQFDFQPLDIQELPFADDTFDMVVANHMLYHVPDFDKALKEVKRVLKGNGRFLAATNGDDHMKEISEFGHMLFPEETAELKDTRLKRDETFFLAFRLENGGELLEPYFCQVDLNIYEDGLQVTEVPPLMAYILSTIADKMTDDIVSKLVNFLEEKLAAHGVIEISKETCLFVCKP